MVVPACMKRTSFSATSRPMFSCDSCVLPPMWGVRITLGMPIKGLAKGSSALLGSVGKTSSAAPAR
ncbi:hypothetical protein D3C72_2027180 [compost metagenome]